MYDIFLSYSTEDRGRLAPLVAALERQGWSVFWDHRSIPIGKDWRDVIEEEVCQCRCILVVWSKESVKSKWVKEEASEGSNRKVLLPIRIDDVLPPFGFRETQTGNFIGWNGTTDYPEFTRLVDRVRLLFEEQARCEAEAVAAQERAAAEQQAREDAERQRRLEEEARLRREAEEAAQHEQLAREKEALEQQAREDAERQRRLEEEARLRREAEEAAERKQLAKEKALAEHEAESHQRWLDEAQARLVAEEAAKQKKLEQERVAEQKAREEKNRQEQLKKERLAAEERARKEAEQRADDKINLHNDKCNDGAELAACQVPIDHILSF